MGWPTCCVARAGQVLSVRIWPSQGRQLCNNQYLADNSELDRLWTRKLMKRICRQEGLKVPQRQPKRRRLWLNDGSCVCL